MNHFIMDIFGPVLLLASTTGQVTSLPENSLEEEKQQVDFGCLPGTGSLTFTEEMLQTQTE